MTPAEFIARIKALTAAGRDREAVEFSARFWPAVSGGFTSQDLMLVSALMEGAETAVALEDAELARSAQER